MASQARRGFIVDARGRRSAVILPIREYERLLEDLHDLAVVAERKREVPVELAELKRRLKRRAPL
jgi:hypothetical protein